MSRECPEYLKKNSLGAWVHVLKNAELPEHGQINEVLMSEISEINMSNVIHVLGVSGIFEKNSHGARDNVLKNMRNFRSIRRMCTNK